MMEVFGRERKLLARKFNSTVQNCTQLNAQMGKLVATLIQTNFCNAYTDTPSCRSKGEYKIYWVEDLTCNHSSVSSVCRSSRFHLSPSHSLARHFTSSSIQSFSHDVATFPAVRTTELLIAATRADCEPRLSFVKPARKVPKRSHRFAWLIERTCRDNRRWSETKNSSNSEFFVYTFVRKPDNPESSFLQRILLIIWLRFAAREGKRSIRKFLAD